MSLNLKFKRYVLKLKLKKLLKLQEAILNLLLKMKNEYR